MKLIIIIDAHGDIYSDYIIDEDNENDIDEHESDPFWDRGQDHNKFTPYGY